MTLTRDTTDLLPPRLLRQQVAYRTAASAVPSVVRSVGFMLKPTDAGAYRERVLSDYVVVYVLRGTGTFTDWLGQRHALSAGCVAQLLPRRAHSVVQDPDGQWAECYLTLDGAFADALARAGAIDERRPVLRPGIDLALVERFAGLLDDLAGAPDAAMPLALARAHELIATLHAMDRGRQAPDDPHARVTEAACLALGRDLDRRIDVASIARQFGLSYERFRKLFRQRTGMSPGQYRIRRRIDRARELIATQRMSNKQVAYALGYRDPFTFSKQFKQVVGMSPDAFRRVV